MGCLKCLISMFYTTILRFCLISATKLQSILIDVAETARYRSSSTAMFQSTFLLPQHVPRREQWFRKIIDVTKMYAPLQAKRHSYPILAKIGTYRQIS